MFDVSVGGNVRTEMSNTEDGLMVGSTDKAGQTFKSFGKRQIIPYGIAVIRASDLRLFRKRTKRMTVAITIAETLIVIPAIAPLLSLCDGPAVVFTASTPDLMMAGAGLGMGGAVVVTCRVRSGA